VAALLRMAEEVEAHLPQPEVEALQWVEVAVRPDRVLPSVLPQEGEAAEPLPQCPDPDQEQVLSR
jgi:hypothetical protein